MNRRGWYASPGALLPMALAATFLWGCAYPALKEGYAAFGVRSDDIPSLLVFAGLRFLLAGLATLGLGGLMRGKLPIPPRSGFAAIGSLALLQTVGQYAFYYVGLANTTGVRASILNGSSSLLTVLLSGLLWPRQERLTGRRLAGCLMGLGGVVLVNLGSGFGEAPFRLLGEGCILLAALMTSLGALANKLTMAGQDPMTITGWQLSLGGLILLLAGGLAGGRLEIPGAKGVLLMGLMVFISSAAFTLWTILLKHHSVGQVAVYNFLTPVFGALLSALFLPGEALSAVTLLALALVAGGIRMVNQHEKQAGIQ